MSDPTDGHDLLTEHADDDRPGTALRRNVIIAAVVLACLGAMVGTAFGLAGGGTPGDNDAAGPSVAPTVTVTVSAEPSAAASESPSTTDGGGECTANCGGNQTSYKSVPHVVGLDESGAKSKVSNAGLNPKVTYVCDDGGGEPGKVTAQDPSSGTSLAAGKTVTLSVRGLKVPNVVGQPKDYAVSLISEAGFGASSSNKPTSSVSPGTVTAQNPSAGSCVKHGSTVTITVATAPTSTASPAAQGNEHSNG
ncbi:PASTA domain-containing protein [Virgisporangium aliadipatigenens]|uniref:PASTA domain-containing protein n=1 Tax=Virgisporangium aliadipatigenens TaxID=741659 RepID=UPI00194277C0|nr:PASTA domain-containing protein [Virgisporangium aliadipatigenens]